MWRVIFSILWKIWIWLNWLKSRDFRGNHFSILRNRLTSKILVKIVDFGFSSFYGYWVFRALRAQLLFKLWTFSLRIHCKKKKFADFIKNIRGFFKFKENGDMWSPKQNVGPISLTVSTFWRFDAVQTDIQTNKVYI